jgi:hypothetical protein
MMRAWPVAAALALAVVVVPGLAEACPSCARGDGGWARSAVVGAMVASPFAAAAVAGFAVVRLLRKPRAAGAVSGRSQPAPSSLPQDGTRDG